MIKNKINDSSGQSETDYFMEIISRYKQKKFSFAEIQQQSEIIRKIIEEKSLTDKAQGLKKIALLGSSTQSFLPAYLVLEGLQHGFVIDVYVEEAGRYRQSIFNDRSQLYLGQSDMIFWHLQLEDFIGQRNLYAGEWDEEKVLSDIVDISMEYCKKTSGNLYISDVHVNRLFPYFDVLSECEKKNLDFNRLLRERFKDENRIRVCGLNDLAGIVGNSLVTDKSLYRMGNVYFSHFMCFALAKKIIFALRTFIYPRIKCIATDLDNTLWGEISAEDGLDGISLGKEYPGYNYLRYQGQLLNLKQQGVLLAICSKNNYEDAMGIIRKHPNMILKENDFQSIKINWDDKVNNLIEISKDLNIGLDSLMFVDDSVIEREKVKAFLPEVFVPDFPSSTDDLSLILSESCELNSFDILNEDIEKAKQYETIKERDHVRSNAPSFKEFIRQLRIKMRIKQLSDQELKRVHQLVLKTNQFNMTTIRYSQSQISDILNNPDWGKYVVYVSDKFGDSGLVGVVFVRLIENKKIWEIETFLLSCRVLGLGIEENICNYLIKKARQTGMETLRGVYSETAKNVSFKDFYKRAGFNSARTESDRLFYEISLKSADDSLSDLISLSEE